MSVSLTLFNPTSLLASAAGGGGTDLLSILYGLSGQASGGNPITALQSAETNQTADVASTAADPQVQRDTAAFTKAVQSATSVQQLLANPTVLKVLLTANGLGDQTDYTALAQQALTSDPSNPSSVANQLSGTNSAWLAAAKTYQFSSKGLAIIQSPSVISTITNAYAEVTWRQSLDASNPGLSNALTFRSEASTITSVDQILGDPIMRDVVTTALGLPLQIALQPLEAQEKAITSQLDITQFKNSSFTEQFVQRYLIAKGSSSGTDSSSSSSGLLV